MKTKTKQEKMRTSLQNHPLFQNTLFCLKEFEQFQANIVQLAEKMSLCLSNYVIDHVAIRVNDIQDAELWLNRLLKSGQILSDNEVNGRKIYLIQLDFPLIIANQQVEIVELPFPKDKKYPQEGWEHIEVVIPFLPNESTNEWVERINSHFLWNKTTRFRVKVSEPKVEGEILPNPSIAVSLSDSSNLTCIKVHPYHIKMVISS